MFCYYGRHYVAFVHDSAQRLWLQFDDHKVKPVPTRDGNAAPVSNCWGDVVARARSVLCVFMSCAIAVCTRSPYILSSRVWPYMHRPRIC